MHADELAIDGDLVRRLVREQLPQYAALDLRPMPSSGSTNILFRLGDDLLVRLPRQPGGSATIEKEARYLPMVRAALTPQVPEVVAIGEPVFGYPERWSVTAWIDGCSPAVPASSDGGADQLAYDLARLVVELAALPVPHGAADDPALSWYRGGRLADVDADFHGLLEECRAIPDLGLDLDRAAAIWADVVTAEPTTGDRRWYHGDLLAENLLVRDGRLAAVLDFGTLGVGRPEVDLVAAWEILDPAARRTFRREAGVDDPAWAVATGWALLIALMTFPYYWESLPARCANRRAMAAAVLAEA